MERFIPCGKLVLVELLDGASDKTSGGLYLPADAKVNAQTRRGTVISQGDYDEDIPLNEGDVVIFGQYAGVEIGEGIRIMKPEDILAKVVDND